MSNCPVSVVICTRNPRADLLDATLDALERQTLPYDKFEVVLVDNGSMPPISQEQLCQNRRQSLRVIVEQRAGHIFARCAGIAAAAADLIVFVDDDNFLAADYLEIAWQIAQREPRVGLFGGITEMKSESPVPNWKLPVIPYLGVRNYGDKPITAFADYWGEWEPIGAGMVARREVAERFVGILDEFPKTRRLGRSGNQLLSGDDSLFARAAYQRGFSCSYQPSLRLTHFLVSRRLRVGYLVRLLEGHGRSNVLLPRALGKEVEPLKLRTLFSRLLHRLINSGPAGFITWFWDVGYAREFRSEKSSQEARSNA